MTVIAQRELRNNISEVLRRAENGERLTITVAGRPVAELGPPRRVSRSASASDLQDILDSTPVDPEWSGELTQARASEAAQARAPWQH